METELNNLSNAKSLKRKPADEIKQMAELGATNLLVDCLGVKAGDELVIVQEPDNTLYDRAVAATVRKVATELSANVNVLSPKLVNSISNFPSSVADAMRVANHTLFLSRLGDYVRFLQLPGSGTKTTCYVYDLEQLASPYATLPDSLLAKLRDQLECALMAATNWRITCPLGTDISGNFNWSSLQGGEDDELLVALFPVSTFKPVPCTSANGVVALSRWLMPGGSTKMAGQNLAFSGTVFADVHDGLITRFHGTKPAHQHVSAHYDRVASTLNINRNRVHSWHLGINPQTYFTKKAEDDLDTWCALSFASPRYLHFHTCGDEPPGEIAWSLFNCSVYIDAEPYWENGEFIWLQRDDVKKTIQEYIVCNKEKENLVRCLFCPSRDIGV